jgi:very-short-patch-repair endonuclease
MPKRLTKEQFIEKANKIHNEKYDYSKFVYINNCTKGVIICNVCHGEFDQMPNAHLNGCGCPICNGKKILKGFNDLETLNPDLEKEWNYEKNNGLRPDQFTCSSNKKVWWKCEKGHEWKANIYNRSNGHNCPYCPTNRSNGEHITHNILKIIVCSKCKYYDSCLQNFNHFTFKYIKQEFRIDCYCSKLKLCIEYHGIQHEKEFGYFKNNFKKQQERDLSLRNYCMEHDLRLIEIWNKDVGVDPIKIRNKLQENLKLVNIKFDKNVVINYNEFLKYDEEKTQKVLNRLLELNYKFQEGYEDYRYNNSYDILNLTCDNNHNYKVNYYSFINRKCKCKKCFYINNRGKNSRSSIRVICLNTLEIFDTIKEASLKYNIFSNSISACCKRKLQSAGKDINGNKLHWMYYNDYLRNTSSRQH